MITSLAIPFINVEAHSSKNLAIKDKIHVLTSKEYEAGIGDKFISLLVGPIIWTVMEIDECVTCKSDNEHIRYFK